MIPQQMPSIAPPFDGVDGRPFSSTTPTDLLTIREASILSGLNPQTLMRWIKKGALNAYGGRRMVRRRDYRVSWSEMFPLVNPDTVAKCYAPRPPGSSRRWKNEMATTAVAGDCARSNQLGLTPTALAEPGSAESTVATAPVAMIDMIDTATSQPTSTWTQAEGAD